MIEVILGIAYIWLFSLTLVHTIIIHWLHSDVLSLKSEIRKLEDKFEKETKVLKE
jgi:hypothetical protein